MSNAKALHDHAQKLFHLVCPRALFLTALLAMPLPGQQTDVRQFDVFVGYGFLNSQHIGLSENGVAAQFGYRPKTWITFGFDYTVAKGDLSLTPALLLPSLQQTLGAQLGQLAGAGLIPPNYSLVVPASSTTQTFAIGPELVYRHFQRVTLFVRPVFAGLIHEAATPAPVDPIQRGVVQGFQQLGLVPPSGAKTDTVGFVGFGGGFDYNFNSHFGWRTQADLVHDHLFSDLLKDGRFTVRFSTGPTFNFGKNIVK